MLGLKRLTHYSFCTRASIVASQHMRQQEMLHLLPLPHLAQMTPKRFLDIYQLGNKAAIEKERARLADEMSRGYFADMAELKKHGGKISLANKVIVPAMAAVKFPDFEVNYSDGKTLKLPIRLSGNVADVDESFVPKASLICLSFRANSQAMANSWSVPFFDTFSQSKDIHLYQSCCPHDGRRRFRSPDSSLVEVSFIDSWFLCLKPIKKLLMWTTRKPNSAENKGTFEKQMVYSFGDHYYFRKELKILNLLTGYIFLLDQFGRIRWQGSGFATKDELSSLLSCTSLLVTE